MIDRISTSIWSNNVKMSTIYVVNILFLNGNSFMNRVGIPRKSSSYRAKYEDISNKFWSLQQVEETEQESEYARLCMDLERMLTEYRNELSELESENIRLQKQLDDTGDIMQKYEEVREEHEYLNSLKSDLDRLRQ